MVLILKIILLKIIFNYDLKKWTRTTFLNKTAYQSRVEVSYYYVHLILFIQDVKCNFIQGFYDSLELVKCEIDLHVESLKAEIDLNRDRIFETIDYRAAETIKLCFKFPCKKQLQFI